MLWSHDEESHNETVYSITVCLLENIILHSFYSLNNHDVITNMRKNLTKY